MGVGQGIAELRLRFLGSVLPYLRERSSAQASGGAAAQQDLVLGADGQEVLGIGVGGVEIGAHYAFLGDTVDGVAASSSATDDLDVGS